MIDSISDEIDLEISRNEIIIPDEIYGPINEFSIYCHDISILTYQEPEKINKLLLTEFVNKNLDLIEFIRNYMGIEKLSAENRNLLRNKVSKI